MGEFRFLHLERRRIDQALPDILEEALAAGWRVVVQAASEERVEALNERLWTYSDESFLPHGSARDGEPHAQPVYPDRQRRQPQRRAVARAAVRRSCRRLSSIADYERVALLFDGRDEEAVAEARREWTEAKAAGAAPSYWRGGRRRRLDAGAVAARWAPSRRQRREAAPRIGRRAALTAAPRPANKTGPEQFPLAVRSPSVNLCDAPILSVRRELGRTR